MNASRKFSSVHSINICWVIEDMEISKTSLVLVQEKSQSGGETSLDQYTCALVEGYQECYGGRGKVEKEKEHQERLCCSTVSQRRKKHSVHVGRSS